MARQGIQVKANKHFGYGFMPFLPVRADSGSKEVRPEGFENHRFLLCIKGFRTGLKTDVSPTSMHN
jgi:hypothetical protein